MYEPWLALDGGLGLGLDSLALICQGAEDMLQPGGFLALETTGRVCAHVRSCVGVHLAAGEQYRHMVCIFANLLW